MPRQTSTAAAPSAYRRQFRLKTYCERLGPAPDGESYVRPARASISKRPENKESPALQGAVGRSTLRARRPKLQGKDGA
jgi:hypothetical protein